MSKISLKPNDSGTGTFTLESPNSNTNRTLTLPDEAGSVLTDVSDIESQVKTATNATGSAPVYACRAWVNFDGTGTVSIRASGNVSSITDLGIGIYRVSFSTGLPDNNFAPVATVQGIQSAVSESTQILNTSTGSFRLDVTWDGSNGATYQRQDANTVSAAVFR